MQNESLNLKNKAFEYNTFIIEDTHQFGRTSSYNIMFILRKFICMSGVFFFKQNII